MQREINALVESLREFIAQPDYPSMVLVGSDSVMAFPFKILAAFDRQDEDNYYLLFPFPCPSAAEYFQQVLSSVQTQLEVLSKELEARGQPALPELPAESLDGRQPLQERLRSLVLYVGQHLPGGDAIVWALLPSQQGDPAGYRQLVEHLLVPEGVPPWMNRHRFLLRDLTAAPRISEELRQAKNDRLLVLDLDLDNDRVCSSLVEMARDTARPPKERMFAFFQLAAIDQAFRRYPESIEKYGVCFNYYQQEGDGPMQALSLSSAGDALLQAGQPQDGLLRHRQSLAIASELESPNLMRPSLYGAGMCCLQLGQAEEAERYFDFANQVAGKLYDPFSKADALEQLGVARLAQSKIEGAVEAWVMGKELAEQYGHEQRVQSVVQRLQDVCEQYGLTQRAEAFRAELAQRREQEQQRMASAEHACGHDHSAHAPSGNAASEVPGE